MRRPCRPCCAAGTLGTLAGGSLLDAIGSSMRNALLLCTAGIGLGACLAVAAFWAAGSFALFALVFAAAQLAMFASAVRCSREAQGLGRMLGRGWQEHSPARHAASLLPCPRPSREDTPPRPPHPLFRVAPFSPAAQAPSNAVCMWGVPPALRPFAISMSVVAIHVLGDVPSPPLLGALQGWLQDWRLRCGPAACAGGDIWNAPACSQAGHCIAAPGAAPTAPPLPHPAHPATPAAPCSMSLASSLLLLGAAAYFIAALVSITAIDYRELAAAAQVGEDDDLGGSGGGTAGLLAAARAAMAAEDADAHGHGLPLEQQGDEEEGGLALGGQPTSPDRPLLGPGGRS